MPEHVVVITGASRGLGAGMAECFAGMGLKLGLCARHRPEAPAGSEAFCEAVDVTDADAVAAFAEAVAQTLGPIDLWINNAGILEPIAPVREIDSARFQQLLTINVLGVFNGSCTFVQHRRNHGGGGVLVNISSGAALRGVAGWSAYCASKAAVDRLSEALALEEAGVGIRVLAVAPGVVDTEMQSTIRATTEENFPSVERFRQMKASGHFNSPGFVARELHAMAFDPARHPETVVVRVANEWEQS